MRKIWLITTDHLEDGLWFPKESDFIAGMNLVAALAAEFPVFILAFILMSNHVHFVLLATRTEAERFINEYKRRHSKYLNKKYGAEKLLKTNGVDIRLIPPGDEAPEKAIAYVQMNPVAANICIHSTQYPWGSGNIFFNPSQAKAHVWTHCRREPAYGYSTAKPECQAIGCWAKAIISCRNRMSGLIMWRTCTGRLKGWIIS